MVRRAALPPLPLSEWEDTKITLHMYLQIVGKVRLGLMPFQNHWWHVPHYVSSRGLTTRPIPVRGGAIQVDFDFVDHRLIVTATDGRHEGFPLEGRSVAEFYSHFFRLLRGFEIDVEILSRPFDQPFDTPFPDDHDHASWDREYVERFWQILVWAYGVMSEFSGRFLGKTTPVHLFWHSFDLALTRFSGRPGPDMEGADPVSREAYSHEVVSFGFWPGDANFPFPAFYSYTSPEPEGIRDQPLGPEGAGWGELRGASLAYYGYEEARTSADPRASVLAFLESSYQAGAQLGDWDLEALTHPEAEVP
jgi:hypothetical protein